MYVHTTHYGLEARKQRENSNPFEVMFFWTRKVPWVRFGGWKKNSVGAAPQGGVFLYSDQITSKVGVTDSPRHGDEKSPWGSCCKKFRSRDIQLQSWKFPQTGVLWPLPAPSFMNWGRKFYFYSKLYICSSLGCICHLSVSAWRKKVGDFWKFWKLYLRGFENGRKID